MAPDRAKKQCETTVNYFSIVARPEGPPECTYRTGAALLQLGFYSSPLCCRWKRSPWKERQWVCKRVLQNHSELIRLWYRNYILIEAN